MTFLFYALLVLLYLACCRMAYLSFEGDWLRDFDLIAQEQRMLIYLSCFGPLSMLAARIAHQAIGKPETATHRIVKFRRQP